MAQQLNVRIFRYDPRVKDEPRYQNYIVPYLPGMTLLDVLQAIYAEQDSSLSFRSSCRMGKCGSCSVCLNGRPVLACRAVVEKNDLLVEPLANFPVIKDLVVARDGFEKRLSSVLASISPSTGKTLMPFRPLDDPNWPECIECLACDAVCPLVAEVPKLFFGPALLSGTAGLGSLLVQSSGGAARGQVELEGRIEVLKKNLAKQNHLCLACRACESVCPAGVKASHLIEATRGEIESSSRHSGSERILRRLIFKEMFPHPGRLEVAGRLLRLYQNSGLQHLVRRLGLGRILPHPLDLMEQLLPPLPSHFFTSSYESRSSPRVERQGSVAFFPGCIMNLIYASASRATVDVLARNGYDTIIPSRQVCCGALHVAAGEMETAKSLARHNISVFSDLEVDVIITSCAACGAMLKEYRHLLHDDPAYAEKARAFSHKIRDISEFLAAIFPLAGPLGKLRKRVTYHDSCHLAHAQGISDEPRQVLHSIPGLELVELKEAKVCCGSAGIYNLTHSDLSMKLLERKMENIAATGVGTVVTSNPGCLLQLRLGSERADMEIETIHIVELLEQSYSNVQDEPDGAMM